MRDYNILIEVTDAGTGEIVGKRVTGTLGVAEQIIKDVPTWIRNHEDQFLIACAVCHKQRPADLITYKEEDSNNDEPVCYECLKELLEGVKQLPEDPLWWGYRHSNGSYQVKRYFSKLDLQEAYQSSFVARIFSEFPAKNREEALKEIKIKDKELEKVSKAVDQDEYKNSQREADDEAFDLASNK